MKRIKLTQQEKEIERNLLHGDFKNASQAEFEKIAEAIAMRRKDTVLNIRINSHDLKQLKDRARKLGIKYQTFIAEILHQIAHSK